MAEIRSCRKTSLLATWNLSNTEFWLRQTFRSNEFFFPGRKHKFYLEIEKNYLNCYLLYLVNPEKIKVNAKVDITYESSSRNLISTEKYLQVHLERHYLTKLLSRTSEITFKFTLAEESKTPGYQTYEPEIKIYELAESLGENRKRKESDLMNKNDVGLLSEDLKNAFLNEEDSDVILRVGDKSYPAHKFILRNRSSVFRAMLGHDMKEKNKGVVDIEDCDPIVFRDFLFYLYTGKLDDLSANNMLDLYYMADKYNVCQLKLNCVDFLMKNLNIDNICDVISLAMKHSERDLFDHAVKFFIKHAEHVFLTVEWQKFLAANPTQANELIIKAFRNKPVK